MVCDKCLKNVPKEDARLTRDDQVLCEKCAYKWGYCEICGSVKPDNWENQLHWDALCFK